MLNFAVKLSTERETRQLTPLFYPRTHEWSEHFKLNEVKIEPLTPVGRVTSSILRLNHMDKVAGRSLLVGINRSMYLKTHY